jgi:hypothetical protein
MGGGGAGLQLACQLGLKSFNQTQTMICLHRLQVGVESSRPGHPRELHKSNCEGGTGHR